MIGVETQSQLVEKVNKQKASDHFRMITYNIFKGMHIQELEKLVFPALGEKGEEKEMEKRNDDNDSGNDIIQLLPMNKRQCLSNSTSSSSSSSTTTTTTTTTSPIPTYGIIGLHCCGDLSSSMCRLFVEAGSHCRLLSFVGCCYNMLTTKQDENHPQLYGFPLNDDLVTLSLTHRARNMIVQVSPFHMPLE